MSLVLKDRATARALGRLVVSYDVNDGEDVMTPFEIIEKYGDNGKDAINHYDITSNVIRKPRKILEESKLFLLLVFIAFFFSFGFSFFCFWFLLLFFLLLVFIAFFFFCFFCFFFLLLFFLFFSFFFFFFLCL